jgi:selenide, water dikinase
LAQVLRPLSNIFSSQDYPALLVGLERADDAAVYQIDDERAIISTMDFFPPVVDDPYAFGAIAAANALSDVYAMGGKPLMAINLVAYPDGLGLEILTEILRGGAEKVCEASAVIAGGHTVTDKEPKYGLSVTGEVHPQRILTKGGAKNGDVLILTKPLGTGVITTAHKREQVEEAHLQGAILGMSHLNRFACELAQKFNIHAMTDITGYSLLGHGHEMAHLSEVDFKIRFDNLRWYDGALQYGQADIFPGGMGRNKDYFEQWVTTPETLQSWQIDLLYDPQTSGGLLMAVSQEQAPELLRQLVEGGENAFVVGDVIEGDGKIHMS